MKVTALQEIILPESYVEIPTEVGYFQMNLSNQEKETLLDALPDLAADGFQWDSYDDYRNYSGRVLRSLRRKGFIRDFLPYKKSFEVNVNGKDIYELVYHIVWDLEKMENLYQNLTSKNSNFDLG